MSKLTLLLILLVAVVAFLFGSYTAPFLVSKLGPSQADSSAGRFTLVMSPLSKTEKFLLDSHTGKIWQLVKSGELPDKPFVCHLMSKLDDLDHQAAVDTKNKLSMKVPSEKQIKDKVVESKMFAIKTVTEPTPSDHATVEIISNGKLSKTKVLREKININDERIEGKKIISELMPNQKVIHNKIISKNTLSVKSANPAKL